MRPRGTHRANRYQRTLVYVALHTLALIWSAAETERGHFRNTWLIIISLILLWTWASMMSLMALEIQDRRQIKERLRYAREMGEYMARVVAIAQEDVEGVFAVGWAGDLVTGAHAPLE